MSRTTQTRTNLNLPFICKACGRAVTPPGSGGTHRNHCPFCLVSLHVDIVPGDRRASCRGIMQPISVWVQSNKEWSIIHRCTQCGVLRTNRVAADDNEMLLFTIAASMMSQLPFPAGKALEEIHRMSIDRGVINETEHP